VVPTDSNGIATAPTMTANKHAGNFVVATSVKGVSTPVTFSLTNLPGAPAALLVVAGTPQSQGTINDYSVPFEVKVTDAHGNPLSGVTVTFQAPAAGPSGTFIIAGTSTATVEVQTDADGLATAPPFTANTEEGSFVVIASISTGLNRTFHLTNSDA